MSERLFHEQLAIAWDALEEIAEMEFGRVLGLDTPAARFARCIEIADRALMAIGKLERNGDDEEK